MNVRERAALSEALEIAAVEICKTVIGHKQPVNLVFKRSSFMQDHSGQFYSTIGSEAVAAEVYGSENS